MRITDFQIAKLSIGLKKPFITALRRVDTVDDIVIKIHTDSDLVGYGEACAVTAITGTTNEEIIKDLNGTIFPALRGQLINDKKIFEVLHSLTSTPEAKACVDIALYDLLAKHKNTSLAHYLGAIHSRLQTDLTISVNEASIMQADAAAAVREGFNFLKIKLDADVQANITRVEMINAVLPSHIKLRLDPNQALDLQGCLEMLRHINTGNIECIEQPFDAKDIVSMKRLKENKIVPVLADESLFNEVDARFLLKEEAADMLNIKLMKCGGIYKALRIAKLAQSHNKTCMIGSMLEGPISLLAAAHFALSQQNITMADLDSPLYLKEHPLLEPFHLKGETICIGQERGLGIDTIMKDTRLFA